MQSYLQAEIKALTSEIESLKSKAAHEALGDVMDKVEKINGVKFLGIKLDNVDMNELRNLGDNLKAQIACSVVVLASACGSDKVNLIVMADDAAMAKGVHAGNIIKAIAPMVGGGGGGRPNMAQAGGKNPAGIEDAINKAKELI